VCKTQRWQSPAAARNEAFNIQSEPQTGSGQVERLVRAHPSLFLLRANCCLASWRQER